MKRLFTSESVTEGHPDKLCDRISDAILDAILKEDPQGRVACEVMATTGTIIVSGEITTTAYVDIPGIVRRTICEVGYDNPNAGFDGNTCAVLVAIDEQSPDIDMGVSASLDLPVQIGAGDQGMMFGYACNETEDFLPLPISLAHKMAYKLAQVRKKNELPFILPDGKTQVTVEYSEDGKPTRIHSVILSTQHLPGFEGKAKFEKKIIEKVIMPVIEQSGIQVEGARIFVNPTGRFVKGGPAADTGLTGRKIIVDTYGGMGRHGGGAFSGKDPTKVDRSAAYMARYIAKNIVAAGIAERCEVQIAYAIGIADPVSIMVDTFGTGVVNDNDIADVINNVFDMRPQAIIEKFGLRRPIYKDTSAYGHFGSVTGNERPWEKTDRIDLLQAKIKI